MNFKCIITICFLSLNSYISMADNDDGFEIVKKDFDFAWKKISFPLSGLSNILQCGKNQRLPANEFDQGLENYFFSKEKWQESLGKYENIYGLNSPIYHYKNLDNKNTIIIANTAHDLPEDASQTAKRAVGNLAFEKVVEKVFSDPVLAKKNINLFVPLAESRSYTAMFMTYQRAHYTLVHINRDAANEVSVNFYDSKGDLSSYYNLDHILAAFKSFHSNHSYRDFNLYYLGHQGLTNNNDCGHYVLNYIAKFVESGRLPHQLSASEINQAITSNPVKSGEVQRPSQGPKDDNILEF